MTVSDGQRRTQTERRRAAVEKILNAAEAVFAARGFNGTTLNDVAKAVGVDTALLRYYFTDKDGLFDAVLQRRSHHVNVIRLEALDRYEAEMGDAVTLEGAIDAFTRPAFELMAADEGWRNFAAIIAYVSSSRGARLVMSVNFDAVTQRLLALVRRALPTADAGEIYYAFHFVIGAFTFSIGQTARIDMLSDGLVSSLDFAAINDRLVITMAAGMRALCGRDMRVPIEEEVRRRIGRAPE